MSHSLPIFDIDAYRAHTPGVAAGIHLNAASAALPSANVVATMTAHLDLESRIGLQAAMARAEEALTATRARAATLFGCRPDQIAFGNGCAQLWSHVFHARTPRRGARILVSRGEWGGNLLALHAAERTHGLRIEIIPTDDAGRIDVARLETRLDDDVWLIAVAAVSSASGVVQPVAAIGALQRPHGSLYMVDAAQTAGRFPVSLADMRADAVVAPTRKWLRGPRGQAVAALSDIALEQLTAPPLLDLGGMVWAAGGEPSMRADARRFEIYDHGVAARLGFGSALDDLLAAGPAAVTAAIDDRVRILHEELAGCDGVVVHEPAGHDAAFLTFDCGLPSATVASALAEAGIAVAIIDRIYAPLELDTRGCPAVLRASPHAYTHPDEIARFVATLQRILRARR